MITFALKLNKKTKFVPLGTDLGAFFNYGDNTSNTGRTASHTQRSTI